MLKLRLVTLRRGASCAPPGAPSVAGRHVDGAADGWCRHGGGAAQSRVAVQFAPAPVPQTGAFDVGSVECGSESVNERATLAWRRSRVRPPMVKMPVAAACPHQVSAVPLHHPDRVPNLESTDRSLKGRAAGLPERSAGVPAFAGRCRSEEPSLSVAQRGSGALRAPARGCARRARACWREPRTRVGAVSERQAGSGNARNRARAAAHWPAQGQRFARCRVQRRAEWVSRPARAK